MLFTKEEKQHMSTTKIQDVPMPEEQPLPMVPKLLNLPDTINGIKYKNLVKRKWLGKNHLLAILIKIILFKIMPLVLVHGVEHAHVQTVTAIVLVTIAIIVVR
jgi:hypothetical protein